MKKIKEDMKVLWWALKLAYRISPREFLFWIIFSCLLAVLPSVALACNRDVVSVLAAHLSSGEGGFGDIVKPLCVLGFILILTGLTQRINGGLLYAVMYDNYYFGLNEYMMDCVQKVDMKTLLDKRFYDDYRYCTARCGSLTDFMSSGCLSVMKLITAISLVCVAFSVSVPIGLVAAICFGVSVTVNIKTTAKLVQYVHQQTSLSSQVRYYSGEMKKPGVAKEMRIYQNQESFLDKWRDAYRKEQDFYLQFDVSRVKYSSLVSAGLYLSSFLILAFSVYQVAQGKLTVDVFLMLYLLGENLAEVNRSFTGALSEALRGFLALRFQYRFLTKVPLQEERLLDNRAIGESIARQRGMSDVVFEGKDLCFSYDGEKEVLHGLNFQIKKGETIALVGSNGSGKSTLVKLLVDLYRPDSGKLLFYGKDYEEYPMGSVNREIGMFFQNFYLYHLSIRENVGFGNLRHLKEDDTILSAMEKGGAMGILEKCGRNLEQILRRDVIKMGMNLSGGEKQKIAVSRTHMTDKEILIFDEPAAALDPIAEMEQFQNIKTKTAGKTSILISHRVGFARMADRIFVLEGGYLAEVGTHEELLKKGGLYANFFHQQAQWYETEENVGVGLTGGRFEPMQEQV